MWPHHVVSEGTEPRRKFPNPHKVTYNLIRDNNKLLAIQKRTVNSVAYMYADLTFLSNTVIKFAIDFKARATPDAGC